MNTPAAPIAAPPWGAGPPPAGRLDATVAVVTGAGRGIGLAIARALVGAGARVAICARSASELAEAARGLAGVEGAMGGEALALPCDVASASDVARFADAVKDRLGAPSVVVNNAGVVARGRLDEQDPGEWRHVVEVNLFGTWLITRAFLPAMRAAGRGRVINISSISGRLGTPRLTAYCSAKHAVVGLTRALAEEVRADGIQVNAICPGSVDTRMLEGSGFAPAMTADDIARVALFLAAAAPDALTGSCIDVFG